MRRPRLLLPLLLISLLTASSMAQTRAAQITDEPAGDARAGETPGKSVPRLVKFSGTLRDGSGQALTGAQAVTFALYAEEGSAVPLWLETQTVVADESGRYTVTLGAAQRGGIPIAMFASGEARWLETRVGSGSDARAQRLMLVSVPFALKAEDADKLGGHSAREFALSSEMEQQIAKAVAEQQTKLQKGTAKVGGQAFYSPDHPISATVQDIAPNGAARFSDSSLVEIVLIQQNGSGFGLNVVSINGSAIRAQSLGVGSGNATILAQATSPTGAPVAVQGESFGQTGIGVQGIATSPSATSNVGVRGEAAGTAGRGVVGMATSGSGPTAGVLGAVSSSAGAGVRGEANTAAGGMGVLGIAGATSGNTIGVQGEVSSSTGTAGLFRSNNSGGKVLLGQGPSATDVFTVDAGGNVTASGTLTATGGLTTTGPVSIGSLNVPSASSASGVVKATNSGSGAAVEGLAAGASNAGVFGRSVGATGVGVRGEANSATGTAGVFNNTASGKILSGQNNGTEVFAVTGSSNEILKVTQTAPGILNPSVANLPPSAIFGYATSTTDSTAGVIGAIESADGAGVIGVNKALSGIDAPGVIGISLSPDGTGVQGESDAPGNSAAGVGVAGTTQGDLGIGVYGRAESMTTLASNPSLFAIGVLGETESESGQGVRGVAYNTSPGAPTIGVSGVNLSDSGVGTSGNAASATGFTIGARGTSASASGLGVLGRATALTGFTVGVRGRTDSPDGLGVHGNATSATGATYGVRGTVSSPSGVAGHFQNSSGGGLILSGIGNGGLQKFSVNTAGDVIAAGQIFATNWVGSGTVSAGGIIHSQSGGIQFPDNTVQTTAATGGGGAQTGTANTWTAIQTFNANSIFGANLGIGTTAPNSALHVNNTSGIQLTDPGFPTLPNIIRASAPDEILYTTRGNHAFVLNSDGSGASSDNLSVFNQATGTTPLLSVIATGNVGIGTAAPGEKLVLSDGAGSIRFRPSSAAIFEVCPTCSFGPGAGHLSLNGGDGPSQGGNIFLGGQQRGDANINAIIFNQGLTERMRIHDGGNVGIGTATPGSALQVVGTVTATNFIGSGAGLTGLSGAQTGTANTFTQPQTMPVLALPATTSSTAGVITSNGFRFIHNFGSSNTFVGVDAGNFTMSGAQNTAIGRNTLLFNTTGGSNTASGAFALYSNSTGAINTASGLAALYNNTIGNNNTASGAYALYSNTTGVQNTASGANALESNTIGNSNTASGLRALALNTSGAQNTAVGNDAGYTTVFGNANTTGSNNTFLGYNSGPGTPTQLTNATAIGANAAVTASNAMILGDSAVSVGIGNTAPTEKLDVTGNIKATAFIGDGSALTGLTGAQTGTANTFTQPQTMPVLALPLTSDSTTGVITSGGNSFIHSFGNENTFIGKAAGNFTMAGNGNTAIGADALQDNTDGGINTAIGLYALRSNTTGNENSATGARALQFNTIGYRNTASGSYALYANTTGNENTATGFAALQVNGIGSFNTASGVYALYSNTEGNENTATGSQALNNNFNGNFNTAMGRYALTFNTAGNNNTALGYKAGHTAVFGNANTTGSSNTFIGYSSGPGTATQLTNATAIGANALVTANNAMILGDSAVSVGIGNTAPTAKLDVTGNIKATAFIGDGSGLTGLTGAATGTANTFTQPQTMPLLALPATTSSSVGVITSNSLPFIHSYGTDNTFVGVNAGNFSMTGYSNTAIGPNALFSNTSGVDNTASGDSALFSNTSGSNNTAHGSQALLLNTTGGGNAATGDFSLYNNTTGLYNTAMGSGTLAGNTDGIGNTALGFQAGWTVNGANANTTGFNNTFLGHNSGPGTSTQLSNATAVGAHALVTQDNSLILGTLSVSVGIGNTAPTEKLDVTGNIKASGTVTAGTVTATSFSGDGSALTGITASDTTSLGGVLAANYARLDVATAQTYTGSLTLPSLALPSTTSSTSGVITSGGSAFIHSFGTQNTFVGLNSGNFTTTATNNTATGFQALQNATTGGANTAMGSLAMASNTTGIENTAFGTAALNSNILGTRNTAIGRSALVGNVGFSNTGVGYLALLNNTSGGNNTAVGSLAGVTAIFANANVTGANNTFLGFQSGPGTPTQLTNATAIGANALVSASNAIVLGNGANVGIGASAPTSKLHVIGSTTFPTPLVFAVQTNTGAYALQGQSPAGAVAGVNTGNQGIGVYGQTPDGQAVRGLATNTTGQNFGVVGASNSNAGIGVFGYAGDSGGTAGAFNNVGGGKILSGQNNGTEVFSVNGSGAVSAASFSGSGAGLTGVVASSASGLALPTTSSSSVGVITSNGVPFIHSFGTDNSFVGAGAGNFTMTGTENTATGLLALFSNTTGYQNTASGARALNANTTGTNNTATGDNALLVNTTGLHNTASGYDALRLNTGGSFNAAVGSYALQQSTSSFNASLGVFSLYNNTSGSNNTALGYQAGTTATPANANTTGSNNTFLGFQSGPGTPTQLTNATAIGANALVTASNAMILGDSSVSVGIGTSAPSQKLHVVGNILATGTVSGDGSGLTNITASNATSLGGIAAANYSRLDVATNQTLSGSLTAPVLALPNTTGATSGVMTLGGTRFAHNFGATTNTFVGQSAGNFTLTGGHNTGLGSQALLSDTSGQRNTGIGSGALIFNTAGSENTATGAAALFNNTTGGFNVATGIDTLSSNTTGSNNTAVGKSAGTTAAFANANTTGSSNTFLGYNSGPGTPTQLTNATAIGANATVTANNALVLGDSAVSVGIGVTAPTAKLDVVGDIKASGAVTIGGGQPIAKHLSASGAVSYVALAGGSCSSVPTITVAGAAVGDSVSIGIDGPLAGASLFMYMGYVSASGVVTIRACNHDSVSASVSGTVKVNVWQQ